MRYLLGITVMLTMGAAFRAESIDGDNLIPNGQFEDDTAQSPPAGWVMWGRSEYKVAGNYTRATTTPHSGKGCFRIHHPAGSAGYVISSPERAIRPRRGMAYEFSFWARCEPAGRCTFGITGYRSADPWTGYVWLHGQTLDLSERWERFSVVLHEGWEVFAEENRLVVLGFMPFVRATRRDGERTLYVDDILVTERPSQRKGRLVADAELGIEPINHRLQPGESLDVTVDAGKVIREITEPIGGVSFHRVAGWDGGPCDADGNYVVPAILEAAIRDMRLPMTRFYGVGDERFSVEVAVDRAAEVCRRIGVPADAVPLELENQGARTKLPPEVWSRAVRRSLERGYGFRRWEISNEPWGKPAFSQPTVYIEHVRSVATAIRQVQPEALIGIDVHQRTPSWCDYILLSTAGHYDWIAPHHYSFLRDIHKAALEDAVLGANYKCLRNIQRINAMIRHYNPGRNVQQYDTEWGMLSGGASGQPGKTFRNGNLYGVLHRITRMIYYAREGLVAGASSWEMFVPPSSPGLGILTMKAPEQRYMMYWAYYYMNRHLGKRALHLQGTTPWYKGERPEFDGIDCSGPLAPMLATLSADGRELYLVFVNGSWDRRIPARVRIQGFEAATCRGVELSHDDPDAHPLLVRKEDLVRSFHAPVSGNRLAFVLPPHAAVFLTLQRQ